MGLSGSGNFLPNKYLKYIIIAFVLAAIGNAAAGYLMQSLSEIREQVRDLREQFHELDTQMAVLKDRMGYLGMLQKNTEAMDRSPPADSFNAAEGNQTPTDR